MDSFHRRVNPIYLDAPNKELYKRAINFFSPGDILTLESHKDRSIILYVPNIEIKYLEDFDNVERLNFEGHKEKRIDLVFLEMKDDNEKFSHFVMDPPQGNKVPLFFFVVLTKDLKTTGKICVWMDWFQSGFLWSRALKNGKLFWDPSADPKLCW